MFERRGCRLSKIYKIQVKRFRIANETCLIDKYFTSWIDSSCVDIVKSLVNNCHCATNRTIRRN